jgi:hypothetical protein
LPGQLYICVIQVLTKPWITAFTATNLGEMKLTNPIKYSDTFHSVTAHVLPCHGHHYIPAQMLDVFDSTGYHDLFQLKVIVDGNELPFYFFSNPRDIALGLL